MTERGSIKADLQALRSAVERGDWSGCLEATERLLRQLPIHQAVALAHEQVARRLPAFERHHPNVPWIREFIEAATRPSSEEDGRVWPEAESDFSGPGANNFTRAVESLWQGSRYTQDAERRAEALAEAIGGSILAEKTESWGLRHPELWARWYQLASAGGDNPTIVDIQLRMVKDPEAVRLRREGWLDVAARLAEAMGTYPRCED